MIWHTYLQNDCFETLHTDLCITHSEYYSYETTTIIMSTKIHLERVKCIRRDLQDYLNCWLPHRIRSCLWLPLSWPFERTPTCRIPSSLVPSIVILADEVQHNLVVHKQGRMLWKKILNDTHGMKSCEKRGQDSTSAHMQMSQACRHRRRSGYNKSHTPWVMHLEPTKNFEVSLGKPVVSEARQED